MCWDVELDYGVVIGTCSGIYLKEDSFVWDANPESFKIIFEQARELEPLVGDFEKALHFAGDESAALAICHKVALLGTNPLAFSLENVLIESYGRVKSKQRLQDVQEEVSISSLRSGFVYLLQGDKYYKIGAAQDVDKRLEQFTPSLPFETKLVCSIATIDMYNVETGLHRMYADKRANGEWFALTDKDVEYIKWLAKSH